jgi:hypothetical protein
MLVLINLSLFKSVLRKKFLPRFDISTLKISNFVQTSTISIIGPSLQTTPGVAAAAAVAVAVAAAVTTAAASRQHSGSSPCN